MNRSGLAKRGVVLLLTVAVVVGLSGAAGTLSGHDVAGLGEEPPAPLSLSEFEPGSTVVEPSPRAGDVTVEATVGPGGGAVLIDDGHENRFSRADIEPLVGALTSVGYEVQFYTEGDLQTQLDDVDAYLVIDPGEEYLEGDVDDVEQFTSEGGRLVVLAEPTRVDSRLRQQDSAVTTLISPYGMSVDTRYLYQLGGSEGGYKHVSARTVEGSPVSGVDRTTHYIAASVTSNGGTTLLWTTSGTHRSGSDETGTYPVAVQRNNALVVGDSSFASASRHTVADNEAFLAYVVEFLVSGGRGTDGDDAPSDTTGDDGTSNESVTEGSSNESTSDGPASAWADAG